MRETIEEKIARCGESMMADEPHTYWDGVVGHTCGIVALGKKHYPVTPYLEVRLGHDRVRTHVSMTWEETRRLHKYLTHTLKQRDKLEKKIKAQNASLQNGR